MVVTVHLVAQVEEDHIEILMVEQELQDKEIMAEVLHHQLLMEVVAEVAQAQ